MPPLADSRHATLPDSSCRRTSKGFQGHHLTGIHSSIFTLLVKCKPTCTDPLPSLGSRIMPAFLMVVKAMSWM
ncbi:hypothetical protein CEXT_365911 [Caerostris extrusa]|uniref:Uncharacterized protein n=1 Tax=Caerostris extrusa TaxID=172846 RepID=A0AAV4PDV4_CAEEX|nr:hypothetical protein CEXT_365911 [Caerostris extrusa]